MAKAYDAIIATIVVASGVTNVTKTMVKSTQWRAGTSGEWLSTDCTLSAGNTYQFRTPLSGMGSGMTAILPNIKSDVTVKWDTSATEITSAGDYFMASYAFNCSNINSISTAGLSGLTTIGNNFMYYFAGYDSGMTSLSAPDLSDVTSVGEYFMNYFATACTNLTSLTVPNTSSLTSVGRNFMYYYANGCSKLTSLDVPDTSGLTSAPISFMNSYASDCSSLTSLPVPDTSNMTSVADYFLAYYASYNTDLTSMGVPDTSKVTTAGNYFLYKYADSCTALTSLAIPDTNKFTSLGTYPMTDYANACNSLTSLILPVSTGWFGSHNISWNVPSGRLGLLYGITSTSASKTAWQGLTDSGETLYTNYIQSTSKVILKGKENFTDTAHPSEVLSKAGVFSFADNTFLSESFSKAQNLVRSFVDHITSLDQLFYQLNVTFREFFTETVNVSDVYSRVLNKVVVIAEALGVSDFVYKVLSPLFRSDYIKASDTASKRASKGLKDTTSLADNIKRRLNGMLVLWEKTAKNILQWAGLKKNDKQEWTKLKDENK